MNSLSHNSNSGAASHANSTSAEATLHLVAQLPAPQGLEDRVNAGLKSTPRGGRILQWPGMLQPAGGWMRGAAAAAIVFVVAGGGWGIYTRVQLSPQARVIVMPRSGVGGGFSSAGAMRTPQTLNPPVIAQPAPAQTGSAKTVSIQPAQVIPLKKTHAKIVPMPHRGAKANAIHTTSAQPAVSAAK